MGPRASRRALRRRHNPFRGLRGLGRPASPPPPRRTTSPEQPRFFFIIAGKCRGPSRANVPYPRLLAPFRSICSIPGLGHKLRHVPGGPQWWNVITAVVLARRRSHRRNATAPLLGFFTLGFDSTTNFCCCCCCCRFAQDSVRFSFLHGNIAMKRTNTVFPKVARQLVFLLFRRYCW